MLLDNQSQNKNKRNSNQMSESLSDSDSLFALQYTAWYYSLWFKHQSVLSPNRNENNILWNLSRTENKRGLRRKRRWKNKLENVEDWTRNSAVKIWVVQESMSFQHSRLQMITMWWGGLRRTKDQDTNDFFIRFMFCLSDVAWCFSKIRNQIENLFSQNYPDGGNS